MLQRHRQRGAVAALLRECASEVPTFELDALSQSRRRYFTVTTFSEHKPTQRSEGRVEAKAHRFDLVSLHALDPRREHASLDLGPCFQRLGAIQPSERTAQQVVRREQQLTLTHALDLQRPWAADAEQHGRERMRLIDHQLRKQHVVAEQRIRSRQDDQMLLSHRRVMGQLYCVAIDIALQQVLEEGLTRHEQKRRQHQVDEHQRARGETPTTRRLDRFGWR